MWSWARTLGDVLVGTVGRGNLHADLKPKAQEQRPQHHKGTGESRRFPKGTDAVGSGEWCLTGCGREGSWSEKEIRSEEFLSASPKSQQFWEGPLCHQ